MCVCQLNEVHTRRGRTNERFQCPAYKSHLMLLCTCRIQTAETHYVQFVAHPNCQQHLTSVWYGKEMGFLQTLSITKKVILSTVVLPFLPFFCISYIVRPQAKVKKHWTVSNSNSHHEKDHASLNTVLIQTPASIRTDSLQVQDFALGGDRYVQVHRRRSLLPHHCVDT